MSQPATANQGVDSIYIHVPFCAHKCEYCAFFSHAPGEGLVDRYVRALIKELEMVRPTAPKTIFFGGGTPSILNLRQWRELLEAMQRLGLTQPDEWTVECNPATVSEDKAHLLREFGVNRISMGVQSLDEKLLERLGRIHSREQVFKSFEILRKAGFENLNIDLMFGIPGQTMAIWKSTLREALDLGSEHLSSYEVIYEQDTPLFEQLKAGEFDVNEELVCDMHEELVSYAASRGYHQYEVANFARDKGDATSATVPTIPSYACKHNINYWRGGYYHAFGPSAAGYVPGEPPSRTKNWSNTQMYCELIEKGQRPIDSREVLSPEKRAGEIAAFGLRMNTGWPLDRFESVTGYSLKNWQNEINELTARGWAVLEPDRFRLTPQGMRFADAAGAEFLR